MLALLLFTFAFATAQPPTNNLVHQRGWSQLERPKRTSEHVISDCMAVMSEPGHYYYKSVGEDATVCGVYLMGDPDQVIEVYFDFLDVPCNSGGLVAFVDGWELSGGYFPSVEDHKLPLSERVSEFCGYRSPKRLFVSSQNAALIQYRIPKRSKGFSFRLSFLKNPTPCNILIESKSEVYTLRNYGRRVNCTLATLYPIQLSVLSLGVGVSMAQVHFKLETGTMHKCPERGIDDFLQIGGGNDLTLNQVSLSETVCGLDFYPGRIVESIFCGVSFAKLVSSGEYDNSVTLAVRQATEEDISEKAIVCPI